MSKKPWKRGPRPLKYLESDTLTSIGVGKDKLRKAATLLKDTSEQHIIGVFTHLKDRLGDPKPMINKDPDILKISEEKVDGVIDAFIDYGFTLSEARAVIHKCPRVLKRSTDTISSIFDVFKKDFSRGEVISIMLKDSNLLTRDSKTLESRYKLLKSRLPDHAKRIVLAFPAIIRSYGEDSLNEKISMFESMSPEVSIHDLLKNPIRLAYSPDTVRKRFQFFKDRGISYNELFISRKKFEKRFGVQL